MRLNSLTFISSLERVILGMAIALEEQKAMGEEIPGDFITNLKTSLMGPLAGMGDTIWQGCCYPNLTGSMYRPDSFW